MPANPRTVATIFRTAGILFALTSGVTAFSACRAHQRGEDAAFYVAQSVTYIALCVVFIALARIKAKASQPQKDVSPNNPK